MKRGADSEEGGVGRNADDAEGTGDGRVSVATRPRGTAISHSGQGRMRGEKRSGWKLAGSGLLYSWTQGFVKHRLEALRQEGTRKERRPFEGLAWDAKRWKKSREGSEGRRARE